MEVIELIDHCRQFAAPLEEVVADNALQTYISAFDACATPAKNSHVTNIFTFHATVPASETKVKVADLEVDHADFDYEQICEEMVRSALAFQPGVHIVFVTDFNSLITLSHPQVSVIRLPMNPLFPMYERVQAMWAYVNSKMFNSPTAFLDSDAFVNARFDWVFHHDMDIGVTYRHGGLMPINEGVFFANSVRPAAIKLFFDQYLTIYRRLIGDPKVKESYGDVRRWRGGQLTLNAMTCPLGKPCALDSAIFYGVSFAYYPCFELNFSFVKDQEYTNDEVSAKTIIHLKGSLKKHLLMKLVALQDSYNEQRQHINLMKP